MTWLAWRQQRWALVAGAAVIAVYGAAATGDARWLVALLADAGDFAQPQFVLQFGFGACWAAPLLARERQLGTIDLAYTQSVPRLRWLLARTLPVFGVAGATTLGLVAVVDGLADLGDPYVLDPLELTRAPAMVAMVLMTVALGFCAGAVLGRTVRAMAATVAGFFGLITVAELILSPMLTRSDPVSRAILEHVFAVDVYVAAVYLVLAVVFYAVALVWMVRKVPGA